MSAARHSEPRRLSGRAASAGAVALACLATGCGTTAPSPVLTAVQNYVNALGEGNLALACGPLDAGAQHAVSRAARRRGCARALARCIPPSVEVARSDPSQLLYANVNFAVTGRRASATVSGTAVARLVRRVTLVKHQRWLLDSAGHFLAGCRAGPRHRARTGHRPSTA